MATYYNTTDLNGKELAIRLSKCQGQNDQFYELFKIYGFLTKWEARRKYVEHFTEIDEIQPGRAINSLVKEGKVYKSTEKIREERGALNFVYKLFPIDGSIPEDFNNQAEKILVEIQFNEDGTPNFDKTLEIFLNKFNSLEKKYK